MPMQAQRGKRMWVVSSTLRPLYPGKALVPNVLEAGLDSELVWTAWKIPPLSVIQSSDRPARSLSLLSYLDRTEGILFNKN